MNAQQQNLLEMLKEIDQLCRKHSITYYTAGGTVIGAVRHKGFIPWDDDVDLYMSRDNFQKFREAFYQEAPAGRKLECIADNPDYNGTIPRYNNENNTQICRHHVLSNASGGSLIDILIMDNYPADDAQRQEYLAKLNVYADMAVIPHSYSQRNRVEYLDLYQHYTQKAKAAGRLAVMKELENDLLAYNEQPSEDYILHWAILTVVLPKKMMGTPVYLDFEDTQVPVPEDWYGYLTQLYGVDWYNVPQVEGQEVHDTINSDVFPYTLYLQERDNVINREKALDLFYSRKLAAIDAQKARRPIEDFLLNLKGKIVSDRLSKELAKTDVSALFQAGDYEAIICLFREFMDLQTSALYVGEIKHQSWLRSNSPAIIPIAPDLLNLLLMTLIKTGNIRTVDKFILAYTKAQRINEISAEVLQADAKIKAVERAYYSKDYAGCLALLEDPALDNLSRPKQYRLLAKAACQPSEEFAKELEAMVQAEPNNMDLRKAYGDVLYALGSLESASEQYKAVISNSRNGIFWQDIADKTAMKPKLLSQPAAYTPRAAELKEQLLIDEVVAICNENNIRYMFSTAAAQMMLSNGNFGYANTPKTIYMDAENAEKFLSAVKNKLPANRRIHYWENNPRVRDFKIMYADTQSVFVHLEHLDEWENVGIHVNIVILRKAPKTKLLSKLSAIKEIMLNVSELSAMEVSTINNFKKKLAYFFICSVYFKLIKPEKFAAKLFRSMLKKEKRHTPDRYLVRRNRTKRLYTDHFLPAANYAQLKTVSLNGKEYVISEVDWQHFESDSGQTQPPVSNAVPKETLFTLIKDDFTWDELRALLNRQAYNRLDWCKFGTNQRNIRNANTKVRKLWTLMLRGYDKTVFLAEYLRLESKLTVPGYVYQYPNWPCLMEAYHRTVLHYRAEKLSFYVCPELTQRYIAFLNERGCEAQGKRYKKASENEQYDMKENFIKMVSLKKDYYLNPDVATLTRVFDQNLREGYLRLDLNENPVGLSQEFINEVLAGVDPEFVSKYPETLPFTEMLAKRLGVEINQICLTNGSAEAIRHIIEAYSRPNGKILGVNPSYAMYKVFSDMYGRQFIPVEYEGTSINVDAFVDQITEDIDLVIVLNPNNPMGDVYTYEDMDRIVEKAKTVKATVLIDEAYYYFYPNSFIDYALKNENVFLTRTFSKLFSLAGARLGYAVGLPAGIENIQKLCTPHNVNAFSLRFAQAIFEKEGMLESLVSTQLEGKAYLVKQLQEKGYNVSAKEGNFVFIQPKTAAEPLRVRLKEEKKILVKVYNGIADYGACLRVTTGPKEAMQKFVDALLEIDC